MMCPNCEQQVPREAQYCIYCAAQLAPAPQAPTVAPTTPATGPTTRLDAEPTPSYTLPSTTRTPARSRQRRQRHQQHQSWNGMPFFLIGLGVLFLTGWWWPGMLLLIGVSSFMNKAGRGRRQEALQGLVFFGGLALLFLTHWWFPGIFLVFAASSLIKGGWRCGW